MIRENRAKSNLKKGGVAIGGFISLMDPAVFEVMGRAGYDFIVMDNEHSHYDKLDLKMMMLASEGNGITTAPFIRIRENNVGNIKNALDMGALGIQVPMVNTYEDAKAVCDAAYYPPKGQRGFGSGQHAIGYGAMDRREYAKFANEQVLTIVQIETVEAVKNLDEILTIPELDAVFVGATDLSCSMGGDIMLNPTHPELRRVMKECVKKIVAAGKFAGVSGISNFQEIPEWMDLGVRMLYVGGDLGAIKEKAKKTVSEVTAIVESHK